MSFCDTNLDPTAPEDRDGIASSIVTVAVKGRSLGLVVEGLSALSRKEPRELPGTVPKGDKYIRAFAAVALLPPPISSPLYYFLSPPRTDISWGTLCFVSLFRFFSLPFQVLQASGAWMQSLSDTWSPR